MLLLSDIGKDAHVLLNYFHRYEADCPPKASPAEWMLDAIGAGQAARLGKRDWADVWRELEELVAVKREILYVKEITLTVDNIDGRTS